jgi:predicted unusual protein kinase regulating ubiquinone biosynthesis (AarF/ABC1/UbiB family)
MRRPAGIPTSRLGRTSRLAGLAVRQLGGDVATRGVGLLRSAEAREKALHRRRIGASDRVAETLGEMKGAAMKAGQVASFLDLGIAEGEEREEIQGRLARLCDSAPALPFEQIRGVVEDGLQRRVDDVFAEISEQPVAAASLGQVYRARLHDGRDVAVKVRYPRIAAAVAADLQNIGLLVRLFKRIAPGVDGRALAHELRQRISEELDYELEAQNQRALARLYRGHPFIVVPEVITSLSCESVLVTEFLDGVHFDEIRRRPQETRDHVGEIAFRFYFGCLYRHCAFSADPHPGNLLLLGDGRVGFVDFGFFKRMSHDDVAGELTVLRAAAEGDAQQLLDAFLRFGFIPDAAGYEAEGLLEQFRALTAWYVVDGERQVTPDLGHTVVTAMRHVHDRERVREVLPAEHLLARRLELMVLALLGQLEARANWHRIAREWIYDDPPSTPLGQQERLFWDGVCRRSSGRRRGDAALQHAR